MVLISPGGHEYGKLAGCFIFFGLFCQRRLGMDGKYHKSLRVAFVFFSTATAAAAASDC